MKPTFRFTTLGPVFLSAFLAILLFLPASLNAAQVFYVSQEAGASDDNTGLSPVHKGGQDGPWKSIGHAASMLKPGQTALIRSGTYREPEINFANSGQEGKPITLAAHEGETPVIDGSGGKDRQCGIQLRDGQSHFVFKGLAVRNMPSSGIATDDSTTKAYNDLTVLDCTLENNGWSGLELTALDGFRVEGVVASGNAFYGLNILPSKDGSISTMNGVINKCVFENNVGDESHGMAINQGQHIVVSNCLARHNRTHGFDVTDWPKKGQVSHHVVFENNRSEDNGLVGFSINSDSHHVVFRNNVAWGNGAEWAGMGNSDGFLCYEGCWEVEWLNNAAVDNAGRGFAVDDKAGTYVKPENRRLVFKNNVSSENGRIAWEECMGLYVSDEGWELEVENNNWHGCYHARVKVAGVNMVGDNGDTYTPGDVNSGKLGRNMSDVPGFVNEEQGDFRLEANSPMIDKGVDVGLPFNGAAPDIGPYEH